MVNVDPWAHMAGRHVRFRDLALYRISRNSYIVVACDGVGGLGSKPGDVVTLEPETVGYFCARVGLIELMCVGATPILVSCTMSVEREPTGRRLLDGVLRQLAEVSLDKRVGMVMSSETNFTTSQTGLGVTIVGLARASNIPFKRIRRGDLVYQIGVARTGLKVGDDDILEAKTLGKIMKLRGVHEVIPLGSGGVRSELAQLDTRGVKIKLAEDLAPYVLSQSAGPANAVLVIIRKREGIRFSLQGIAAPLPVRLIGSVEHS